MSGPHRLYSIKNSRKRCGEITATKNHRCAARRLSFGPCIGKSRQASVENLRSGGGEDARTFVDDDGGRGPARGYIRSGAGCDLEFKRYRRTPNTVPTSTASFGPSSQNNVSISSAITTVDGWTFNSGALAYTFVNSIILSFTGAGIINGGSATINNNFGVLDFHNTSTADSATINNSGGLVRFFDSSTAGTAGHFDHFKSNPILQQQHGRQRDDHEQQRYFFPGQQHGWQR